MSEQIAGYSLKEWSLIILLFVLGIAVSVFVAVLVIAIMNNPNIVLKGEIDLSQFTGIVIGIAMVAVTLVGVQLGHRNTAQAIHDNDQTWLHEQKP
jgi:hypothetical protein